jgi:hypothetical protein
MQACLSSFLARDPLWFSSPLEDYRNTLSALPASVLRTVARHLGSRKGVLEGELDTIEMQDNTRAWNTKATVNLCRKIMMRMDSYLVEHFLQQVQCSS